MTGGSCETRYRVTVGLNTMKTTVLNSRLIASASYDDAVGSLFVQLKDGAKREFRVARVMYENLISSESPGWYYTRHLRPLLKG